MKIIDETIIFKSIPKFFLLERYGLKPNTIRIIKGKELNEFMDVQSDLKGITIINSETNDRFIRELTDISSITFSDVDLWVFSWKSYDLITE